MIFSVSLSCRRRCVFFSELLSFQFIRISFPSPSGFMKTAGYTGNYSLWSTPVISFRRGAAAFAGKQGLQTTKSNFLVAWIGILSSVHGKAPTRYFSELLLPGQFCPVTIDHKYVATDEGSLTT